MTTCSISHGYLLTQRDSNPLGCGFQNFSDVARHVGKRTDKFNLGDQQSSTSLDAAHLLRTMART